MYTLIYRVDRTILVLTRNNLQSTSSLAHMLACQMEVQEVVDGKGLFDWFLGSTTYESLTKHLSNCHLIRLHSTLLRV